MSYMHFHCWLLFPLQLKKRESRCIHEYTVPSMTEYGRADPKMFTCTCECFNAFSLFRFYHPFKKRPEQVKQECFLFLLNQLNCT